jgi:hypothetical protein
LTRATAAGPTVTTSETFGGLTPQLRAVAQAIAREEGFQVTGSIPQRANNPGDLVLGPPSIGEGITVFATPGDGWAALYQQLARILIGTSAHYTLDMSIAEMGRIWSGGSAAWASNVASALGVPTSTRLLEVLT